MNAAFRMSALLLTALSCSLTACSPANQPLQNGSPATTPSNQAPAGSQPVLAPQASALAKPFRLKLLADASLQRFVIQQQSNFALCVGQIQQLETQLTLSGNLSQASQQALQAKGARITTTNGRSVVSLNRSLKLGELLAGLEIELGDLSAGRAEVRSIFRDAAGQELGFVAYSLDLSVSSDNLVELKLAAGADSDKPGCPLLMATVSGASFQGAGGQASSSQALPNPVTSASPEQAAETQPAITTAAPTGVKVTEQTTNALTLQWEASPKASGYRLFLDNVKVAEQATGQQYRFTNLSSDRSYRLGVQALQGSSASEIVSLNSATVSFSSGGGGGGGGGGGSSEVVQPVVLAPSISTMSPSSGIVGTTVILTGSQFTGTSSVTINGVSVPYTLNSDSQITLSVPAGAGDGSFNVSNSAGSTASVSFEVTNKVWFVNDDAAGNNDGSSWAHAYQDLQLALTSAAAGDEIWVAAGSYKPSTTGNTAASFQLLSNRNLYGGFAGTESLLSQRVWANHPTVLTGDLTGNDNYSDASYSDLSDNSLNVVKGANSVNFDGFTIRGGYAAGAVKGGGMLNASVTPTMKNLIFENNYSDSSGGALAVTLANGTQISNSVFRNNGVFLTAAKGGAVSIESGPSTLTDLHFENNFAGLNTASGQGGGLYLSANIYNLTRVSFSGNKVSSAASNGQGGAVYAMGAQLTVDQSSFSDNIVSDAASNGKGGALYLQGCQFTGTALKLTGNKTSVGNSGGGGGGIWSDASMLNLSDSVLSANQSTGSGGGLYSTGNTLTLNRVVLANNTAGVGGGWYSLSESPSLTNIVFANNESTSYGGGAYFDDAIAELKHTTFYNNFSIYNGKAVYVDKGTVNLTDSIVWAATTVSLLYSSNGATLNLSNSIVRNLSAQPINILTGNLDSDPLFALSSNLIGPDNAWMTQDDGLIVSSSSPAVGIASQGTTVDITNRNRDASPDLGAYEYIAP